jgi:hypothetical protein
MTAVRILSIVVFFVFIQITVPAADMEQTPSKRYLEVEKIALKWQEGLFGSTRVHEKALDDYLYECIGKEIELPMDFVMVRPYETGLVTIKCAFAPRTWLDVRGVIEKADLMKISGQQQAGWWRSSIIVGIKGKIKKYKIDRTFTERRLILFVDNLRLIVKQGAR